ncbi:hypothetical protein BWK63_04075 [Flavobacterium covae]|uniref:RHS repeat-associated core domain-containing protein n=1 Tax=Flavobacterium covae TaxID=2906076 RepID=A0ABW8PKN0_9FLAO|nr:MULTISPECIES: RHS repeat-associated core domain-containing protein [Flavobacterium]OWP81724.1 hypothetical protein BWK63_04075 [Flavobacterium covae]POR21370.1 hypothetical protein BWK57_10350 [Flavobacterium columnare]
MDGQLSQHVEYIPFGEVLFEEHSSSISMPYLFNGKELDRETNLTYYGARYLDMKTSLWLSVDSEMEKYPNVSSYVYCLNNPVLFVDPDGRDVITWLVHSYDKNQSSKGYGTKNFVKAMNHFAKTDYGKQFLLQFMKKGQSVYGITAKENGKHSDKNLNLVDLVLDKSSPSERGTILVQSNGTTWEGKTVFPSSKDDMDLTIYIKNTDRESTVELGETITHEAALHGSHYEENVNDIKNNKPVKDKGSQDHKALKSADAKNKAYRNYNNTMKQLSKIDPKYATEQKREQGKNHQ